MAINTSKGRVRFEAFELDLRAGELLKGDVKVRLEQPFRILTMLLEHAGEVVTREEIRKRLWPNDTIEQKWPFLPDSQTVNTPISFSDLLTVSYLSPEQVRAKDLDTRGICSRSEKFCDIRDPVP